MAYSTNTLIKVPYVTCDSCTVLLCEAKIVRFRHQRKIISVNTFSHNPIYQFQQLNCITKLIDVADLQIWLLWHLVFFFSGKYHHFLRVPLLRSDPEEPRRVSDCHLTQSGFWSDTCIYDDPLSVLIPIDTNIKENNYMQNLWIGRTFQERRLFLSLALN